MLEVAYSYLYISVLILLGIAMFIALIRSITGKTMVNRFVGVNILTTLVAIVICILSLFLKESYISDVAVVFVMISCIAVMLLNKIYINLFQKKKDDEKEEN